MIASGAPWLFRGRLLDPGVDPPAHDGAVGDHDARSDDVSLDAAGCTDIEPRARANVTDDRAMNRHRLGDDFGVDMRVGSNSQGLISNLDRSVDLAVDRDVL